MNIDNFSNKNKEDVIVSTPGIRGGVQMQGFLHNGEVKWLTHLRPVRFVGLLSKAGVTGKLLELSNSSTLLIAPEEGAAAVRADRSTDADYGFYQINSYHLDQSTVNTAQPIVYFCSAQNGKLYKAALSGIGSPTPSSITRLPIPSGIRCDGGKILDILGIPSTNGTPTERYIVFSYSENGLAAVGGFKIQ